MKTLKIAVLALCLGGLGVSSALAGPVLFDYGFNIDGVIYRPGDTVPGLDDSGFDWGTGLGTLILTFMPSPGTYDILAFFDHEIDEPINTFFNELGSTSGSPAGGQTWEIDEPGYVFGDIWLNFLAGALDNSIGTPDPEDVSMAMGWNVTVGPGEWAVLTYMIGITPPAGFYLKHRDPDSDIDLYFSSTAVTGIIPEPGTVLLLTTGLALLLLAGRRTR